MHKRVVQALGRVLSGVHPTLSIEITRECPLSCPGCYAYEPGHLGDAGPLRSVADYRGQALIDGVLDLVRARRPVFVSIVGGEPLVRCRELDILLPRLSEMGVSVQLVTSAVRQIPRAWAAIPHLHVVVSVDGLRADHDLRRTPATYDRILSSIGGHSLTIHCTVTQQMAHRGTDYEEFLAFWSARPEVKQIWFSLFTPQVGATDAETLSPQLRHDALLTLERLRPAWNKLFLPDLVLAGYRKPPRSPAECIFARTTSCVTANLVDKITPCQFGGNPDCTQCGCMASAAMNAVGDYKILGMLKVRTLYETSAWIGRTCSGN
jgi:organic radical activating enzyme